MGETHEHERLAVELIRLYFQSTRNLILGCLLLLGLGLMAGWFILSPQVDAKLQSLRGSIYDRNGKELAVSHKANSLYANPREVQDVEGLAKRLAPLLNMSEDTLRSRLTAQGNFVWLKRAMEPSEYNRIAEVLRSEKARGLDFIAESRRIYPNELLAAHVLGFVGTDDKGLAGVEMSMDAAIKGKLIHLTLDSGMQAAVEQALENKMAQAKVQSATMIVMNPKTGEILAMASRPAFNPNAFFRYPEQAWRNPAISSIQLNAATVKEQLSDAGALVGSSEGFQSLAEACGFGQPTGIELPGEESGSVSAVAVTPLQLLTAFSALANDGKLLKPQIIKEIRDGAGKLVSASSPQLVRQAVTPEMARKLAAVKGYRLAGKTSSAGPLGDGQSATDSGRAVDLFAGFWPLAEGQLTGLVVVDSPRGLSQGGELAASIFAEAMAKTGQLGKLAPVR